MTPKETFAHVSVVGLLCLLLECSWGCNIGGGSSPPPPPPSPSFTISLSQGNVTLAQGSASQAVQVSVNAQNGFSGAVTVTIVGLISGVSVSPSSPLSVTSGNPATFTLSASTTAQIAQQSINVHAVSGFLIVDTPVQLTVTGVAVPDPFHPIGGTLTHGFYDESRQLLFVTNLGLNELDVISGQDFSIRARIPIPQPVGIDQMVDGKTLVIGTAAQEIVTVNEDTFSVTPHPYSAVGTINVSLFFPSVVAMANGKVLIIGQEQGVESDNILDGGHVLIEWDSNANTFAQLEPTAQNNSSIWETDSLGRSADHKWAIFSADQFYLYSSDSDNLKSVPLNTANPPQNQFGIRGYAINTNGTKIAVVSSSQVTFLDNTLSALGTTTIPGAFQTSRTAVQFSVDDSRLYLQYDLPIAVEEIDTSSYTALGYLSAEVNQDNEDSNERMLTTDSTGRAFFGLSGGVRMVDLTKPLVPNQANGSFNGPGCGLPPTALSLNASSQVQLPFVYKNFSFYVGGQPAPVLSGGTMASIPASPILGPVDTECIDIGGDTAVIADGVSYGVDPIAVSANLLPPAGNPKVYVFGFGFGKTSSEIPAIEVGGQPALKVTSLGDQFFGTLQGMAVQVPNGNPGQSAGIAVTSSIGSGTLSSAVSYYPTPTIIPASGLLQLIYDSHRNLLYALKATEVDVLNPATLQWQSPLPLPQPTPAVSYEVMALSPDGTHLVIGSADGHFVVLNPDQPTQASLVMHTPDPSRSGSLAITKFNKAILTGYSPLELDLSTLTFTPLTVSTGGVIRSSADGAKLYSADTNSSDGTVYSIDPSTYAVQSERFGLMFWADLAVSPDGSQFAAVDGDVASAGDFVGFFDSGARYLNANVYPDFAVPDDSIVLGASFSPGGKVLVVALGDAIELWDTAQGTLRACLMTPEELQVIGGTGPVAPLLALDATGQTIYAVSASGLTVLKLPMPMDQMLPMQWPILTVPTGNQQVGLRGSGTSRMAAMHRKPQQ
jgi:hypothetical protein